MVGELDHAGGAERDGREFEKKKKRERKGKANVCGCGMPMHLGGKCGAKSAKFHSTITKYY